MSRKVVQYAPDVFRKLRGVICVYKPKDLTDKGLKHDIVNSLKRDLEGLPNYKYERQALKKTLAELPSGDSKQSDSGGQAVVQYTGVVSPGSSGLAYYANLPVPDGMPLSQHRLVLGNKYQSKDFRSHCIHPLSEKSSGVMLLSMGKGREMYTDLIEDANYIRVYHVSGKFGTMTDDFTDTGRLIQKTTYHHITKPKLEKICSHSQNMHQKYMFEYSGVSPDSQEAYELAVKGMIRPLTPDTPPILYGIKCIEFEPPDFTLEIHSINENCDYLCSLIHDIGLHLKSSAVATKVRRVRYGFFHLEHALTFTQWHYDSILENINVCRKLLTPENLLMTHTLTAQNESPSHGNKPTKLLQSPKSIHDLYFMRKRTRKQSDHQSKGK